jgi:hypothetical protein
MEGIAKSLTTFLMGEGRKREGQRRREEGGEASMLFV